jgi:hypothetical protein
VLWFIELPSASRPWSPGSFTPERLNKTIPGPQTGGKQSPCHGGSRSFPRRTRDRSMVIHAILGTRGDRVTRRHPLGFVSLRHSLE